MNLPFEKKKGPSQSKIHPKIPPITPNTPPIIAPKIPNTAPNAPAINPIIPAPIPIQIGKVSRRMMKIRMVDDEELLFLFAIKVTFIHALQRLCYANNDLKSAEFPRFFLLPSS